jgi:hypothetical protein
MWRKRPPKITEGSEVAIFKPRKGDSGVWTVLGQVPDSDPRDPAYALVRERDGLRKTSRRSRLIVLHAGLDQ